MPAGDGVREVLGVFILTEGELRSNSEDAAIGGHEKWFDVAAVFAGRQADRVDHYEADFGARRALVLVRRINDSHR